MSLKLLRKSRVDDMDSGQYKREVIDIASPGRPWSLDGWGSATVQANGEYRTDWKSKKKPAPPDPKAEIWSYVWDDSDDPNKAKYTYSEGKTTKADAIAAATAKVKEITERRAKQAAEREKNTKKPGF